MRYEHAHVWLSFNNDTGGIDGAGVDYFGGSYGWRQERLAHVSGHDWRWWEVINSQIIAKLSQEGWELVSVTGMRSATDLWFKRPAG
jgi:hypothetical protein